MWNQQVIIALQRQNFNIIYLANFAKETVTLLAHVYVSFVSMDACGALCYEENTNIFSQFWPTSHVNVTDDYKRYQSSVVSKHYNMFLVDTKCLCYLGNMRIILLVSLCTCTITFANASVHFNDNGCTNKENIVCLRPLIFDPS